MKMGTQKPKILGCSKSSSKMEIFKNTSLPQETRKISNTYFKFIPKTNQKNKDKQNSELVEGKK